MPIVREAEQVNPDGDGSTPRAETPEDPRLDWSVIIDAPEIGTFLKKAETARAKEYRTKVNSFLNVALQSRLMAGDLADVSTILQRGPAFSVRAGEFADTNESFRKMLDVITAPDNPAVMFVFAALPFAMQFFRNHEPQLQEARNIRATRKTMTKEERKAAKAERPKVQFKILGRTITLPFRIKIDLGKTLMMNTTDPQYLVSAVIGDPKIRAELTKRYGVKWNATGPN